MKIIFFVMVFLLAAAAMSRAMDRPLSLSVLIGGVDTNTAWFSPGADPSRDTVSFSLNIRDNNLIEGWSVTVSDCTGRTVWKRGGERNRDVPLDPGIFLSRLIEKKSNVVIPPELSWDGTSDSGAILPEGKYYLSARVWDEMGNTLVSATDDIIIDITPPGGSVSLEYNIFYPGSQGKKSLIFISQDLSDKGFWKAEIRDGVGLLVKSWDWGQNPPEELEWDGKNEKGEIEPEGTYDYIVYGIDRAGNKTILPVTGINISLKKRSVFLNPERSGFSPAAGSPSNSIRLFPAVSESSGMVSWVLRIEDRSYRTIREIEGKSLPPFILWDGKDSNGKTVNDGYFVCSLECDYFDNEKIFSPKSLINAYSKNPAEGPLKALRVTLIRRPKSNGTDVRIRGN